MDNMKILDKINENINSAISGKEDVIKLALVTLLSKGHLLLEDVPGVGKTTLAKVIAKTIGADFGRIQFTPDTLPSDVTGITVYNMKDGRFDFIEGAIMNNIVLADEINRTSPKTQSSLLEAMAEKQITVDRKTYKMPPIFMVIATENPVEFLGTYNLPEAQKDRFFMKLSIGYPDACDEKNIINRYLLNEKFTEVNSVATKEEILAMQNEITKIVVHEDIISYVLNIAGKTRNNDNIKLGMSPRASMALIRGCQSLAYISGRNFVLPDDVLQLLEPVIYHRIVLSGEALINQMTVGEVMEKIKAEVKIPIL